MLVMRNSWRIGGVASVTGLLLIASMMLVGCSRTKGPSTSGESPSSTIVAGASTTPTVSTTGGGSESPRLPTDSSPGVSKEEPSGSSAAATPTLMAGQLTLRDFFMPDERLKEDIYDVATETTQKGVGVAIRGNDVQVLELRLGNRFNELTFKAGQDNDSESSDFVLRVEIYKNGVSDTFVDIPFNEIHQFEVDVTNVNALKIELTSRNGDGKPHESSKKITAVVFDINLE